jgi:hypothetical protein
MPPAPQRDANVAARQIYFHRAQARLRSNADDFVWDRDAVAAAIAELVGTEEFYLDEGEPAEEQHLCAVVDRAQAPHRVRFYRVRRRNLPETEAGGVFQALELGERDGLAESIHLVLFDDGVIGAEYNHYGPRTSTFGTFLARRCDQDVAIRPLIHSNVIDEILDMREIRTVRLKVETEAIGALRQHDGGLSGALDAAELFSAGRYVDLKLATKPQDAAFADRVKALLRGLRDGGALDHLKAAEVYGQKGDGLFDTLNVMKDVVTVNARIARESPRSRALDRHAAYAAVEEAHRALAQEIAAGGTITVA